MVKLFIKGKEARVGMQVETTRGERATLLNWSAPGEKSRGGRVSIEIEGNGRWDYFPSIIYGEFKDVD